MFAVIVIGLFTVIQNWLDFKYHAFPNIKCTDQSFDFFGGLVFPPSVVSFRFDWNNSSEPILCIQYIIPPRFVAPFLLTRTNQTNRQTALPYFLPSFFPFDVRRIALPCGAVTCGSGTSVSRSGRCCTLLGGFWGLVSVVRVYSHKVSRVIIVN